MIKIKHSNLIILGSGPAGYTAAIYSARANLNPVIITGIEFGGQLSTTTYIENWPGDYKNLTGPCLMERMHKHAEKFGTEIIFDQILETNLSEKPIILKGEKYKYSCHALIIATGASSRYLNLPSEKKYLGKGVSSCAVCDGFFYKKKKVAVIGGGNSALEEALYLSNIANEVHLIHRRDKFRAEKILINRFMEKVKNNKIFFHKNFILKEIIGNEFNVTNILIKNTLNNKYKNLEISGVFIAIGRIPNTDIFKNQLALKDGYILVNSKKNSHMTSTSIPGVFAAGDVIDRRYRQAITSAATGCMAALDAENYIDSMDNRN